MLNQTRIVSARAGSNLPRALRKKVDKAVARAGVRTKRQAPAPVAEFPVGRWATADIEQEPPSTLYLNAAGMGFMSLEQQAVSRTARMHAPAATASTPLAAMPETPLHRRRALAFATKEPRHASWINNRGVTARKVCKTYNQPR